MLPESHTAKAKELATAQFGNASRRASMSTEYEQLWSLSPAQIDEALRVMSELPPIPEHLGRGLFVLSIDTVFLLRDARTGRILPNQGADLYGNQEADLHLLLGESRAYLRLSRRSTCALFLSLPFAEVTEEMMTLIESIQAALPFRLSPKQGALASQCPRNALLQAARETFITTDRQSQLAGRVS